MDKEVRIPYEITDDVSAGSDPQKFTSIALLVLAISGSFLCRMYPWRWDVTPEGEAEVVIVDEWESLSHFLTGEPAVAREETYSNGDVCSGPLKDGHPDGTWRKIKDGESSYFHFRNRKRL